MFNFDSTSRVFTPSNRWCDLCFTKYDNIFKKQKHLLSKCHLKKALNKREILNEPESIYCGYCLTIPSGKKQFEYHLKSLNHLKQKKKYNLFVKDNIFSNIIINLDNRFELGNDEIIYNLKYYIILIIF